MVRSLTPTQQWRKKQLMDSGAFLSKKLTYSNRNQRRQVHRLLTTCHQKFIENYLELQFKQSYVNPVKNTLDAPSSENIYFGRNLKAIEENQVSRPSHGVGSGSQTIGTDKREQKIHHMFPQLESLSNLMSGKLGREKNILVDFNAASVKVYFNGKGTGLHSDVLYSLSGKPLVNNSQKPGSPVFIFTTGDPKKLCFRKVGQGNTPIPWSDLDFILEDGSCCFLHPSDEVPQKEQVCLNKKSMDRVTQHIVWKHKAKAMSWKAVIVSLMLRVVVTENVVDAHSGKLSVGDTHGEKLGRNELFDREKQLFYDDPGCLLKYCDVRKHLSER
jgi:hypothetical protein